MTPSSRSRASTAVFLAATLAFTALAAGCGGEKTAPPKALTQSQTKKIVPDAASVPGWNVTLGPSAASADDAKTRQIPPCSGGKRNLCKGMRYMAQSAIRREKTTEITFSALAYRDERGAKVMFGRYMDVYGKDVAVDARTIDIGALGDQRAARMGRGNTFHGTSHAAVAEVRVDSVIVQVTVVSRSNDELTQPLVEQVVSFAVRRAEQVEERGVTGERLKVPVS
ncbi:hypothetical protein AB0D78_43750 [Streptomyces avermitilis]|uniref:hypothetical protein n=1 Tax=Streptomyces avermitilis TaxID=33903 RepID=UPI0033D8AB07